MPSRVLGILLIIAALMMGYYWWSYFAGGGDVMTRAGTPRSSPAPIADGWLALCALFAGYGFITGARYTAAFGLMTTSAIFYLAARDVTFDIENGLYALTSANDAMKFEVFINIS